MHKRNLSHFAIIGVLSVLCLMLLTGPAWAQGCSVPDDGSGTASLPPAGCAYLSPNEVHMIINGLPVGTTIRLAPIHQDFICRSPIPGSHCGTPGGALGGETESFGSMIHLDMKGTGMFSGYHRIINLPLNCQTSTAPRTPHAGVQSFD